MEGRDEEECGAEKLMLTRTNSLAKPTNERHYMRTGLGCPSIAGHSRLNDIAIRQMQVVTTAAATKRLR